jgi:hypothetical protein
MSPDERTSDFGMWQDGPERQLVGLSRREPLLHERLVASCYRTEAELPLPAGSCRLCSGLLGGHSWQIALRRALRAET